MFGALDEVFVNDLIPMIDAAAFNEKVKLVWLSIGTTESERFQTSVKNYRAALEQAGIKAGFHESPGTAHEWQTWRRSLREFAPLLFKWSVSLPQIVV